MAMVVTRGRRFRFRLIFPDLFPRSESALFAAFDPLRRTTMDKKFLAFVLALAFLAAPFKSVFAFECKVVEVTKKEIIMQCKEKQIVSNGIKEKIKLKIEKLDK